MVWKNFIHYLINKYLKNYIERLDYEKLKLSLKNGQSFFLFFRFVDSFSVSLIIGNVLLENLRLKPEALVSRIDFQNISPYF
jgi:hypothetical protein